MNTNMSLGVFKFDNELDIELLQEEFKAGFWLVWVPPDDGSDRTISLPELVLCSELRRAYLPYRTILVEDDSGGKVCFVVPITEDFSYSEINSLLKCIISRHSDWTESNYFFIKSYKNIPASFGRLIGYRVACSRFQEQRLKLLGEII